MQNILVRVMLVALVLVVAVGILVVVSVCGSSSMLSIFGMQNCSMTVVHHMSVFMLIFAATAVTMIVLAVVFLQSFMATIPYARVSMSNDAARRVKQGRERGDSVFYEARRLFARGALQKRDDPDIDK